MEDYELLFIDIFFIEQAVDQRIWNHHQEAQRPHLSLYGRDRNNENISIWWNVWNQYHELTIRRQELKYWEDMKHNPWDATLIDDITRWIIPNNEWLILIRHPISLDQYNEHFRQRAPSITWCSLIVGHITLSENLLIQFCIYDATQQDIITRKYGRFFELSDPQDPILLPEMQAIFRAYLSLWLNIFVDEPEITDIQSLHTDVESNMEVLLSQIPHKKRLKKLWDLRIWIDHTRATALEKRHREHYTHFFTDEKLGIPHCFLTSSWVWANDIVLYILKEEIPDILDWAEIQFYYENACQSGTTQVYGNTRILCLCPSNLNPRREWSLENHEKLYHEQVRCLIDLARSHPELSYYIILDKTTRLEVPTSMILPVEDLPDNVTVIATASLTKYQRGDLNYFFGSVAVYKNPLLSKKIQKKLESSPHKLSHDQILTLPRLRKSELEGNTINRKRNMQAFREGFIRELNREELGIFMPEIIENDFSIFVIMPLPEILYYLQYGTIPSVKIGVIGEDTHMLQIGKIEQDHPVYMDKEKVLSFLFLDILQESKKFELRDSFWFRHNSLISMFSEYWTLYFQHRSSLPLKHVSVPRISFWFELDEKESLKQWIIFAINYLEYLYNHIGIPYSEDEIATPPSSSPTPLDPSHSK